MVKWSPNGIAVMDQVGINKQLVDVIYPCSEGWEGSDVCFHPSLCMLKTAQTCLLEEFYV